MPINEIQLPSPLPVLPCPASLLPLLLLAPPPPPPPPLPLSLSQSKQTKLLPINVVKSEALSVLLTDDIQQGALPYDWPDVRGDAPSTGCDIPHITLQNNESSIAFNWNISNVRDTDLRPLHPPSPPQQMSTDSSSSRSPRNSRRQPMLDLPMAAMTCQQYPTIESQTSECRYGENLMFPKDQTIAYQTGLPQYSLINSSSQVECKVLYQEQEQSSTQPQRRLAYQKQQRIPFQMSDNQDVSGRKRPASNDMYNSAAKGRMVNDKNRSPIKRSATETPILSNAQTMFQSLPGAALMHAHIFTINTPAVDTFCHRIPMLDFLEEFLEPRPLHPQPWQSAQQPASRNSLSIASVPGMLQILISYSVTLY